MTKIIVLGASGALGKHVAQQAVDAGHEVSVAVRTPGRSRCCHQLCGFG
jgi:uncharacterized protein YbjT (DUF2867 family)